MKSSMKPNFPHDHDANEDVFVLHVLHHSDPGGCGPARGPRRPGARGRSPRRRERRRAPGVAGTVALNGVHPDGSEEP